MDEIVNPNTKQIINGEGFLNPDVEDYLTSTLREKKSPTRGNLIVTFDIVFPKYLTAGKKDQLKSILPP